MARSVRPELLTRLGVAVGDRIRIGEASFEIRGVVIREAGRSLSMFTLGPRVFIDHADLSATGLLEFASRVRRQILVRVDEEKLQELVWDLEGALANEFVRVRSYKEAGDQLARRLNRGESYLSLTGLVILDPGRCRRLERRSGVRGAEAPEYRRPQVRGSDDPAGARESTSCRCSS